MATNYLSLKSTVTYQKDRTAVAQGSLLGASTSNQTAWLSTISLPGFSTLTGSTIVGGQLVTQGQITLIGQQLSKPTCYIEMATNGTNSSYIDFHSHDQVEVDYSTRIFSQGGSTIGGGTLFLTASTCSFSNSIGIGTSNPQYKLQVNSGSINATNYSQHHWNNNSIGIGVFFSTPTYWKIATLGLNTAPSSFGALTVKGTLGGFVNPATPTMHVDLSFSTRGNITVTGSVQSSNIANAQAIMDIGYVTTATGYDVYLYLKTGDYYTFDFVTSGHLGSTENVYLYDPATVVPTTTSPGTITSLTSMCQIYNTSGNIGIGTNAPGAPLTVLGSSSGATFGLQFVSATNTLSSTASTYDMLQRWYENTGNQNYLDLMWVRTSTGSTWTTSGQRFQSRTDATWQGFIEFNGTNNNAGVTIGAGASGTNPNSVSGVMYVTSGGNVGIGTASPYKLLHLTGSSTGDIAALITNTNTAVSSSASLAFGLWGSSGSGTGTSSPAAQISAIVMNASQGNTDLAFNVYTGNAVAPTYTLVECMRITAGGNVGIGTASPNAKLHVCTSDAGNIIATDSAVGSQAVFSIRKAGSQKASLYVPGNSNDLALYTDTAGYNVMVVGGDGYVYLNTTRYGNGTLSVSSGQVLSSSDRRIKTDITYAPKEGNLDKLLQLKPATYSFTNTRYADLHMGFIAQDVETLFPLCVDGKKYEYVFEVEKDEYGNDTIKPLLDEHGEPVWKRDANGERIIRPRGFDDRALLAHTVLSIQELYEQSKATEQALRQELAEVKASNATLASQLAALTAWAQAQGFSA